MFGKLIASTIIITVKREKTLSPKSKMKFKLLLNKKEEFSEDVYGFWFKSEEELRFKPGQFLEWTLEHKNPDSRGEKRFFTIASSPTEEGILLVTKIIENSSSFKKSLKSLEEGDEIVAEGPYGDFILPEDKEKRLAFIAGGIGLTPFRSILKYLLDKKEKRSITLFYGVNLLEETVFNDLFREAGEFLDFEMVYVIKNPPIGWQGESGYIDGDMVKKYAKDAGDFIFYVSGPEPMVRDTSEKLVQAGINKKLIKHDYFPGYGEI